MKIHPLNKIVYLRVEKPKVGDLVIESRDAAVEYAEVLEIGEGVPDLKTGDFVFVKSWAIDIVTHEGERYYFCNIESGGILAKVQ